jgi:hypothetical protein
MMASPLGSQTYTATPYNSFICGSVSSGNPTQCKAEQADSEAAYTQALLWNATGNTVYAKNAIAIMTAWETTFTSGHPASTADSNGPLQSGWVGTQWARAAEIMRYTNSGWSPSAATAFGAWLTKIYLPPMATVPCDNGNWELTIDEALINIAVYNDDRTTFNNAVSRWEARAPAYIYLTSDGSSPKPPTPCAQSTAPWGNAGVSPVYVQGLLQETYRDAQHANFGFAGMVDTAETARQQGVDLYHWSDMATRMQASMEFQAQYLKPNSATPPANLVFSYQNTWEIAYNEYVTRLGGSLPLMGAVIPLNRPTGVNHMQAWETMTHAGMGSIGLPPATIP